MSLILLDSSQIIYVRPTHLWYVSDHDHPKVITGFGLPFLSSCTEDLGYTSYIYIYIYVSSRVPYPGSLIYVEEEDRGWPYGVTGLGFPLVSWYLGQLHQVYTSGDSGSRPTHSHPHLGLLFISFCRSLIDTWSPGKGMEVREKWSCLRREVRIEP